jgi:hypothetical protein
MIRSKRREYFGMHLTRAQRESLKAEALRRGMSMSALAALFISTGLAATGIAPVEEPLSKEVDVPLPLEAE